MASGNGERQQQHMSSTAPATNEQQKEDLGKKLFEIMARKTHLRDMIQFMPPPKPVYDYKQYVTYTLQSSLEHLERSGNDRKLQRKGELDTKYFQGYDFDDNTVYDALKAAMDTIEATVKPLQAAHDAKKEAMRVEIQQLDEEELAVRLAMQKRIAGLESTKRAAKRAAKRARN